MIVGIWRIGAVLGKIWVEMGENWDAVGETVVIRRRMRVDSFWRVGYVMFAVVNVGGGEVGEI